MPIDYCSVITEESARIVTALNAKRDGRIPWSDRWSVATCAKHVAGTHHVVTKVIEDRPTAGFGIFSTLSMPDKSDPDLGEWLTAGTATLVEQLDVTEPSAECWSWHPVRNTAGFWARRMAHETLVHRWDAEAGAGAVGPAMDPAVAADSVDEYLEVFVPVSRGGQQAPAGPSFHFEATDEGRSWFLQLPGQGASEIGDTPVETAVHLRGPAEGLLLVAWGRLDPAAAGVEVLGDHAVWDRWRELVPPM